MGKLIRIIDLNRQDKLTVALEDASTTGPAKAAKATPKPESKANRIEAQIFNAVKRLGPKSIQIGMDEQDFLKAYPNAFHGISAATRKVLNDLDVSEWVVPKSPAVAKREGYPTSTTVRFYKGRAFSITMAYWSSHLGADRMREVRKKFYNDVGDTEIYPPVGIVEDVLGNYGNLYVFDKIGIKVMFFEVKNAGLANGWNIRVYDSNALKKLTDMNADAFTVLGWKIKL